MYTVIRYFTDLQDNDYAYEVGDTYPREGLSPTEERIAELSGSDNKQGTPLIAAVAEIVKADEGKAPEDESAEDKHNKKRRKYND